VESECQANMLFVSGEYNSVGIGVSPKESGNNDTDFTSLQIGGNGNIYAHTPASDGHSLVLAQNVYNGSDNSYISTDEASRYYQQSGSHHFQVAASGSANASITWIPSLILTVDGRGLSQYTAKAWGQVDMSNMSLNDSHNVSSVTDVSTGRAQLNFANNLANTYYSAVGAAPEGYISQTHTHAVGSFRLNAADTNGSLADRDKNSFIVFGD